MNSKVTIFEVTKRPGYELVTAAGGDRPAYVGSREWNERQKPYSRQESLNVHRKSRFAGMGPILTSR